jgi:hypothetical protein
MIRIVCYGRPRCGQTLDHPTRVVSLDPQNHIVSVR